MIRLRKPLSYYQEKYGTWRYGLNKLYLLMEKQHNRGQEGAGLACVKMQAAPGEEFMYRERGLGSGAITEIFDTVHHRIDSFTPEQLADVTFVEQCVPFAGELYMGHLRYSTTGRSGLSYVHPFLRRNNWRARNLSLCGNFNMTNVDEIFQALTSIGQHPRFNSDTYILLEHVGHRLDRESDRLYAEATAKGLTGQDITDYIEHHMDVTNVLRQASPLWDGGYVVCGITGSGEMFSMRDPWGIRPAFWYADDEVMVLASERPVIQTAFNLEVEQIQELKPGEALIMSHNGNLRTCQILPPKKLQACSFERIYFSRGSDRDIYNERKALGSLLKDSILSAINGEVEDSVFSFIPNTAEVAFYGMCEGMEQHLIEKRIKALSALKRIPSKEELWAIANTRVRREKVAIKDIKLRTFITESNSRNDLAAHVYDITYGCLRPYTDNLVIIDDSIVRGTTLRESIIRILDRLHPKKLVLCSSSPQIRYPDYYGIDMARLSEFIAFKAAVALIHDNKDEQRLVDVYEKCKAQVLLPMDKQINCVKEIYAPFTDEQISAKMVELLKAPEVKTDIQIVFQTIEGLHKACPKHPGDWYFSGDYPTPGGTKNVNLAYISFFENEYSKQA